MNKMFHLRSQISKIAPLKTVIRKYSEAHERSLNQVQLIGRTGGEPQKRGTETNPVVIFSLATSINYKSGDDNTPNQKVEWHRICVFKPVLRDVVFNYLKKGQRMYVSGRLSYGEVSDEAGRRTVLTSIIADDVIFFSS